MVDIDNSYLEVIVDIGQYRPICLIELTQTEADIFAETWLMIDVDHGTKW